MEFDFDAELSKLSREELERLAKSMMTGGVALSFAVTPDTHPAETRVGG